jgi:VanZ family protein
MQKTFFAAALMITIFWASSQSMGGKTPSINIPDKWAHLLLYGLLATLYLRHPFILSKGAKGVFWAIAAASLYGASDEFHQKFVDGRYADVGDWVADTLGAIFAASLYYIWIPYRKLLELPLLYKNKSVETELH